MRFADLFTTARTLHLIFSKYFFKENLIMQDVQNIPNPDVNSNEANEDFGSHSSVEQDLENEDIEQIDDSDTHEREVEPGVEQKPDVEPQ